MRQKGKYRGQQKRGRTGRERERESERERERERGGVTKPKKNINLFRQSDSDVVSQCCMQSKNNEIMRIATRV